jgi:hypothetical protein
MKPKIAKVFFTVLGLLALSLPVYTHHGVQAYDAKNPVTLKGTIAKFEWINPHSQIHLDVTDASGKVVHWNFECQPPNILHHAGWTRNSLKPGDQVTVIGNPAKNGMPIGIITKIVLSSGEELTPIEK